MLPTTEQIAKAAYFRWQHRGATHGWHDCDWREAEAALRFAFHYEVVAYEGPALCDVPTRPPLKRNSNATRRVCRFCEHSEPRTSFGAPVAILPTALDLAGLVTSSMCDDCNDMFSKGIDRAFVQFLDDSESASTCLPLPAYKGLAKCVVAALPADLVEVCQESIEWLAHEGLEFEPDLAHAPAPLRHRFSQGSQRPWFAIAAKREPELETPAIVAFFGTSDATLVATLPFCTSDEDLDGARLELPGIPILDGLQRWPGPVATSRLAIGASNRAQRRHAQFI